MDSRDPFRAFPAPSHGRPLRLPRLVSKMDGAAGRPAVIGEVTDTDVTDVGDAAAWFLA